MIHLEELRFKNFLSSGNLQNVVRLDEWNKLLISGKNGAGKSLIQAALFFVLFGKTDRGLTKNQFVNSTNGKDCLVSLKMSLGSKQYLIQRGIKPNIFDIEEDGVSLSKNASIKDMQDHFEQNILKSNLRVFSQVVSMGTTSYIPFLQLSTPHRREVIERLLDIEILSELSKACKVRGSQIQESLRSTRQEKEIYQEKIRSQNDLIAKLSSQTDQIAEYNKAQLDVIKDRLKEFIVKKEAAEKQIELLGQQVSAEHNAKISDLTDDIANLNASFKQCNETIRFLSGHDVCSTCHQKIDDAHKKKIIENLSSTIKVSSETASIKKQERDDWLLVRDEQAVISNNIRSLSAEVYSIKSMMKTLLEQGKKLNTKIPTSVVDVSEEQTKLQTMESILKEIQDRHDTLIEEEEVSTLSTQFFKDTSIKARIIRQYIPYINQQMNHYLSLLNFNVKFVLDENFEEKILSKGRDDHTYHSFSMGERQRIDLAMMFTWRDLAAKKNSLRINLLFFDEILDGSLDGSGVEDLFAILDTLKMKTNLVVISHRNDSLEKFDAHLRVTKTKGFSTYAFA